METTPERETFDPGTEPRGVRLTQTEEVVRRAAFELIRGGQPAGTTDLVRMTGLQPAKVREAVASAARKGRMVVDASGRVVGSKGLSLVPTRHRLRLREDAFHTWCAVDAVGIPAALRADAVATTPCALCHRSLRIGFRGGRASGDPEIRAWLPDIQECTSMVDEYCPLANLFCSDEHLQRWRHAAGDSPGAVLSLEATVQLGRRWWADAPNPSTS